MTSHVTQATGARADPEASYYQTIEEFFVSRRGDPLFLSNADWLLIRKWRGAGIPLRIVLRGIADALDSHAHSWGRDRKVGSLAYCAAEVEAASDRWQRALSLGGAEERDAAAFLATYAETLERAPGLGRAAAPMAGVLAAALRQRVSEEPSSRGLEEWLRARESELLEALRGDMGGPALAAIEVEVDDDLAPYSFRMPPKVLAQIRAQSVARRILEVHGLGRLSLFHL
jgi:hypothetical protein